MLNAALAYPGMGKQLAEIKARQSDADESDSTELIGDLLTLQDADLSTVGKNVKELLLGGGNPESSETYRGVPALKSAACAKDTCCVWKYIADDMAQLFRGSSGRCTKWARAAVRLGFHDAGGWSKQTAAQGLPGGADGSICLNDELTLPENQGLQDIGAKMKEWYAKWHDQQGFSTVTMSDLIQMSANVATVVCPLGPRVRSFVGRKDSSVQNPRLLPSPFQEADALIQLFEDKTISPHGLVALLGAHTTSQQFFVNTSRAGDPQDSTPGVWDVLFYGQTLGTAPTPQRVFMFPSDVSLSQHPSTKPEFQAFAGSGGQQHWNEDYAREYIRLSLLGVNNINNLTECTKVLPSAITRYSAPDQRNMDKWLNSLGSQSPLAKKLSDAINNGESILSNLILTILGFIF
ncbi:peroxidase [Truncatella angustata]|uniref:Peroxidase n=1 Tax=Truncatella angustata TaxID=152316 RepID=A0A9P8UKV4_9PEZI|nr:peroxidase [Truncatella angustata]KAH6654043.1 peroxidase [Truncatella angustata]